MSVQGNASERLAGPVCYMSKERASCERSSFRARAPSGRPLARTGTRSLPHSPHAPPGAIGPGPPTRRAGSRWPPPLFPGVSSVPGKLKTHPCGQAPTCPSRDRAEMASPPAGGPSLCVGRGLASLLPSRATRAETLRGPQALCAQHGDHR